MEKKESKTANKNRYFYEQTFKIENFNIKNELIKTTKYNEIDKKNQNNKT